MEVKKMYFHGPICAAIIACKQATNEPHIGQMEPQNITA